MRFTQKAFLVIEFSLISLFFHFIVSNKVVKKLLLFIIIPFLVYVLVDYATTEKTKINFYLLVIECLIFLVYVVYYFFEKFKSDSSIPLYQTKDFWLVSAFLIYSAGNFFLFLFRNSVIQDKSAEFQYTLIYSIFTIFKNILLCLGISMKNDVGNKVASQTTPVKDDWEIPSEFKKNNQ